jgi:hypothetical protein
LPSRFASRFSFHDITNTRQRHLGASTEAVSKQMVSCHLAKGGKEDAREPRQAKEAICFHYCVDFQDEAQTDDISMGQERQVLHPIKHMPH